MEKQFVSLQSLCFNLKKIIVQNMKAMTQSDQGPKVINIKSQGDPIQRQTD